MSMEPGAWTQHNSLLSQLFICRLPKLEINSNPEGWKKTFQIIKLQCKVQISNRKEIYV